MVTITPYGEEFRMKKTLLAALATAGLALFAADAAMAHNNHSSCQKGVYGWHRHVWKYGQKHRVECSPAVIHHHKKHCVTKCKWIGPFKQCKTHCD
jgi:hypothetical protein